MRPCMQVVDAALQLLRSSLRNGVLQGKGPAMVALLDPIMPLVVSKTFNTKP